MLPFGDKKEINADRHDGKIDPRKLGELLSEFFSKGSG